MQPEIHDGFIVYKNGYGPVWVCLHTGPMMKTISSRDDYTDIMGDMCYESIGGTLILSTIPRNKITGIDFNRDVPPIDMAIGMYPKFINRTNGSDVRQYKNKYAFVTSNKKDYYERLRIYKALWSYIRASGDLIIFLHREYALIKNYPSVMDLITFNDCGIRRDVLKKIVDDVNDSNKDFFSKIENNFKNVTYMEELRTFELKDFFETEKKDAVKIIKQYADSKIYNKLKNEATENNFLVACKSALRNMPKPSITLEKIFSAESAIGPKKEIIKNGNKVAIEIEINSFMSTWYPKETASIIIDIINKIKEVEEYKKLGFTQTQILKFL